MPIAPDLLAQYQAIYQESVIIAPGRYRLNVVTKRRDRRQHE